METSTPPAKKRGRPKKVIADDAAPSTAVSDAVKSVRKASTKAAAAPKTKKDAAAAAAAAAAAVVAEKPAAKKTVKSAKTTVTKAATGKAGKVEAGAEKEKDGVVKKAARQATPVTPATSRILEEVMAKGGLKKSAVEKGQTTERMHGSVNAASEGAQATATTAQQISSSTSSQPQTSQAKPTASITRPAAPSQQPTPPSASSQAPLFPSTSTAEAKPTPTPRTTTIPLPSQPRHPHTFSHPAPSRPKPPTAEELVALQTERYIRAGKMPPQYKWAERRVVAIIVGIPFVLVVGWDLWKRWREHMRDKFEAEGRPVPGWWGERPEPRERPKGWRT